MPAEVISSEKITHLTKDRPIPKGAGGKSRRRPTRGHHKKVIAFIFEIDYRKIIFLSLSLSLSI